MSPRLIRLLENDVYSAVLGVLLLLASLPALWMLFSGGLFDYTASVQYYGYNESMDADATYSEMSVEQRSVVDTLVAQPTQATEVNSMNGMKDGMVIAYTPDSVAGHPAMYTLQVEQELRVLPIVGLVVMLAGLGLVLDCAVCMLSDG